MKKFTVASGVSVLLLFGVAERAEAALTLFQSYVGNVAVSTDGFGSLSQSGTISASVPAGATVLGAYLYTSTFQTHTGAGSSLNGTPVAYGATIPNPSISSGFVAAARADVTAIVAPVINGGPGGVYNFAITETSGFQDGEALVVAYSLPSLPIATVGILDGFSASGGDSFSLNFATPLNPSDPAFFAEMALGIGFSTGGSQVSNVRVNGTLISATAGGHDDGELANGGLITVGGFNDPLSPLLPIGATDHERYNLAPYVSQGATSIFVQTNNPSNDDNIFLATFYVSGLAGINEPPPVTNPVPDPANTLALLGSGLAALFSLKLSRTR